MSLPQQAEMTGNIPMAVRIAEAVHTNAVSIVPTATGLTPSQYAGLLQPANASQGSVKGPGFEIIGRDSQLLMITVKPGETITIEPGSMAHADANLTMETNMGDIGEALQRAFCAGESLSVPRQATAPRQILMGFSNSTSAPLHVSATPVTPSKIVPVDLAQHYGITIAKGAYFAITGPDIRLGTKIIRSIGAFLGGGSLFLTTLSGQGIAFISGAGTIIQKELAAGESHVIDNDAFLCCSASVTIDVKMAGSAGAMCVGGQGLFNTEFRGPGMIMYQSMSSMKVAHFLAAH